jgi:hypothetical protein
MGSGRERGSCFGEYLKIDSSDFNHVGTHRLHGIFIAAGKGILKNASVANAHIADLAPTILFSMNQPVPDDMDGVVLQDIFTEEFLRGKEPQFFSADRNRNTKSVMSDYTHQESKKIEERLRGLGYF